MVEPGSFERIDYRVAQRVATIGLNRPERMNAISRQTMAEIDQAMDAIEADDAIAVAILHGVGPTFSAGMDLKDDAAAGVTGRQGWRRVLSENLDFTLRFWDCSKVTIASVHGYCMAAACDLAVACDVTIAEEGAIFGKPELRFASVISAMLLPHIVGPKAAKALLLGAEDRIPAKRALALGMVDRLVPPGQGLTEAEKTARRIAALDDVAVRLTKQALNRSADAMGLRTALAESLDIGVEIEATETPSRREFKERVRRDGLKAALAWREGRLAE